MNTLRWPEFEHRMAARVAEVVSASPELQEEYKALPGASSRFLIPWLTTFYWSVVLLFLFYSLLEYSSTDPAKDAPLFMLVISLFMSLMTCIRASSLHDSYSVPWAVLPCHGMPLGDKQASEVIQETWLNGSSWMFLMAIGGFLLISAVVGHVEVLFLGAVLNWVLAMSLGILAVAHSWSRLVGSCRVVFLCAALTIAVAIGASQKPSWLMPCAETGLWLLPSGWLNRAVIQAVFLGQPLWLAAALGVVSVLAAMAWRALSRMHMLLDWSNLEGRSGDTRGEEYEEDVVPPAEPRDAAEMAHYVRSGEWLKPWCAAAPGPMEWPLLKGLSARGMTLLEFQLARSPAWVKSQIRLAMAVLTAYLATFIFKTAAPTILLIAIVGAVLIGLLLPSLGNRCLMSKLLMDGIVVSHLVYWPVGYWELFRSYFMINARRNILFVPLGCMLAWLASQTGIFPGACTYVYLGKLVVLTILSQPMFFAFGISSTTHDSRFVRITLFLVVGTLLVLIAGVAGLLFGNTPATFLALAVGMGAASFGTCAAYGWCYNRMVFDLMRPARKDEL